jgi:hypothetical protein
MSHELAANNIAVLKHGEVCPMPYALCPMPYARRVPHVTEKGYIMSVRLTVIPVGAGPPISLLKTINLVKPPRPR